MGESEHHAALVDRIAGYVRKCHEGNAGLSVLIDSRTVPAERRPGRISGFTPDVLVRTVPASFVIIGEAKSFSDFFTPRTAVQLAAFVTYLRMQQHPQLVIATPLAASAAARVLIRRLKTQLHAPNVGVEFLIG